MPMYLTQAIHKGRRERAGATAAICGAEQASWSQLCLLYTSPSPRDS